MQTVFTSQASDEDCRQGVFTSDALTGLQAYQNNRLLSLSRAVHSLLKPEEQPCSGFQLTVEFAVESREMSELMP